MNGNRGKRVLRRLWIGTILLAAYASLLAASPPDAGFKIQWLHPRQVGDRQRAHIVLNRTLEHVVKKADKELSRKAQNSRTEFQGDYEVNEVREDGFPSKLTITVEKATTKIELAAAIELVKPKTVLIVERKDEKDTVVPADESVKLSDDAQQLLTALAWLGGPQNEANYRGLLDAGKPQKIGDHWNVSPSAGAKKMEGFDPRLEAKAVSGIAELTKPPHAEDFLEVKYAFSAKSDNAPAGAPPDMMPVGATQKISGTVRLPADNSTGLVSCSERIITERNFKTKPGELERDKTPQEHIFRQIESAEVRIEYGKKGPEVGDKGPRKGASGK
ncbi:MAG TPA: hypothetical protein VGY55_22100 [Pirellulales bacterium]|jgi:hypothetical protein|nr:hypothetical protein [Pirellulales bacterium]